MRKDILVIGGNNFLSDVKTMLSPLGMEAEPAKNYSEIRAKLKNKNINVIIFDDSWCRRDNDLRDKALKILQKTKKDFIVVSSKRKTESVSSARKSGAADYIIKPYNWREFTARFNAVINKKTRISCIGGGSGLFTLLMGLKNLPDVLLTSIVSTSDDGGSSGRLKASFGMLPPGDIRRSLVALSNAPQIMNRLVQYRFRKGGGIKGHSFGNLLLTALTEIKGSVSEAVRQIGDILNIRGIVLPVAVTKTTLCALFEDGTVIKGESRIDLGKGRDVKLRIKKCWHEPEPKCDINAYASILNSDIVTIGPGDLFTSVVTNLLIKDIRKAILKTAAKKVYICNLMTKPGETTGYNAIAHVKEIIKYLGHDCLDYVIISDTKLSGKAVRKYSKKQQFPVKRGDIREIAKITKAKIIVADVGCKTELIHHNSAKIKKEIRKIIGHSEKWR